MPNSVVILGRSLTLAELHAAARGGTPVDLDPEALRALGLTRARLETELTQGSVIYGVNTGFGALSDQRIPAERSEALQLNLLRSHAMGVGPALPLDVVRALLVVRAHTLALGASGIRPEVVEAVVALLRANVLPVVPCQGSVGASGDLAPLAHLALPLIGEGEAWFAGQRISGADALAKAGLAPLRLAAKEGISLINGTQVTATMGALSAWDGAELLVAADILGTLSLDAALGTATACDPRIHRVKPHPGQARSAAIVRELLAGSPLAQSHRDCGEVQDAYALRCIPQVHGAARAALHYAAQALAIEINSMTDNPLVLPDEAGSFAVLSGGNFHAGSVALPIDHLTAALTTLATMSERRIDRFMNPHTSRGLPAFLATDPGVESGFMMAHVTAAALASECKTQSFPACVDTIPTSAGKEDHVSMGPIAARKLAAVVDNLARVLAIEALVATRALELRDHPTSAALQGVAEAIRAHVPKPIGDASQGREIDTLAEVIRDGGIRRAAGLAPELATVGI